MAWTIGAAISTSTASLTTAGSSRIAAPSPTGGLTPARRSDDLRAGPDGGAGCRRPTQSGAVAGGGLPVRVRRGDRDTGIATDTGCRGASGAQPVGRLRRAAALDGTGVTARGRVLATAGTLPGHLGRSGLIGVQRKGERTHCRRQSGDVGDHGR